MGEALMASLRSVGTSRNCIALISSMLTNSLSQRPTAKECLQHEWFTSRTASPCFGQLGGNAVPERVVGCGGPRRIHGRSLTGAQRVDDATIPLDDPCLSTNLYRMVQSPTGLPQSLLAAPTSTRFHLTLLTYAKLAPALAGLWPTPTPTAWLSTRPAATSTPWPTGRPMPYIAMRSGLRLAAGQTSLPVQSTAP